MNNESTTIKVLTHAQCPSCHQELIVSMEAAAPVVRGLLTPEIIASAKEEVRTKMTALSLAEDIKKEFVAWLDASDTVVAPEDVEGIIQDLIKK